MVTSVGAVPVVRHSLFAERSFTRQRLAKKLGSLDEMTKQKARDEGKLFLATLNSTTLPPENALKLAAFVDSVYLPRSEKSTRPSTYRGYKTLWNQLKPFCADLWTRDVRARHVQLVLDRMAATERLGINSDHQQTRGEACSASQESAEPDRGTHLPQWRKERDGP